MTDNEMTPAPLERPGVWPNPQGGSDMAKGTCALCPAKAHAEGLCWRHVVERRAALGDVCSVDACGEGRFSRGMCSRHASAAYAREHGRRDLTFSITPAGADRERAGGGPRR